MFRQRLTLCTWDFPGIFVYNFKINVMVKYRYGNCLWCSFLIMWKYRARKPKLMIEKTRKPSGRNSLVPHFYVKVGDRTFDFHNYIPFDEWWEFIWFMGSFRCEAWVD